jgi:hypothetical protein
VGSTRREGGAAPRARTAFAPHEPAESPGNDQEGSDAATRSEEGHQAGLYEHVKESELDQGRSEDLAEEIAARTVNKERGRAGESRERSRSSTHDISSGRRGGLRSGTDKPKGRTYDQLYNEARHMGISGRSKMSKAELERAVDRPGTKRS